MSILKLAFVFISLCTMTSSIFTYDVNSYATFYIIQEGTADSGSVLKDLTSKTEVECNLECTAMHACKSVNYRANDGRCQLIMRDKKESAQFLIENSGWTYITTDELLKDAGAGCNRQSLCKKNKCIQICNGKRYKCICIRNYCGQQCGKEITDCTAVYKSGSKQDGVYNININGSDANINVFCKMTENNEGWIVIQRRVDNSINFYRNWMEYKAGFGDLSGNMWIGLDNLHLLAGQGKRVALRVELKHTLRPNRKYFADYSRFVVKNEAEKYKLVISGYSGNAGDAMAYHNGMKFSTYDNVNDQSNGGNCASQWQGAWWYNLCHRANLNGLFPNGSNTDPRFMSWYPLTYSFGNISFSEMKIKYH